MRKFPCISLLPVATVLLLTGCGDSHPLPQLPDASGAAVPSASAAALARSSAISPATAADAASATGTFAPDTSASADKAARVVDDCNVDSVDGKPVDGVSLERTSAALFAGWAADSATGAVPGHVRLVLKAVQGSKAFAVETATGVMRPDVAQARKVPAFAASGWSVQADLSAVAPGRYDTALQYRIGGKPVTCDPHHVVTIR